MLTGFLRNYLPRHRNRFNQLLHLVGVPVTFVATPILLATDAEWQWPLASFLCGYALQLAGHAIEGNDAGEVVFVKKMLRMPYTEYGPESEYSSCEGHNDDKTGS